MENISADGHWLQDETFCLNGETIFRKAGEAVGATLMKEWRQLRADRPELFHTLRIWAQPAAVVDSIVWRWQLDLEGSEFRAVVRLTDALPAAWTDCSKEACWLLNQLQVCVPKGLTAICQPTDTHFAKPGKDAARSEKERLRSEMAAACHRLGQPTQYLSGKAEVLSVANALHRGMVDLAATRETVVQSLRSGGWLAWRPLPGGLVKAEEAHDLQGPDPGWASRHLLAAGRVTKAQLVGRYSWLDDDGRPTLSDSAEQDKELAEAAAAQEKARGWRVLPPWVRDDDICLEEQVDCQLETDLALEDAHSYLSEAEEKAFAVCLIHPRARADEDELAELQKLTVWKKASLALQDNKRKRGRKLRKKKRKDLAAVWRLAKGTADPAKRLTKVVPEAGKAGKAGKAARKALRKHQLSNLKLVRKALKTKGKTAKKKADELAAKEMLLDETQLPKVRIVKSDEHDLIRNVTAVQLMLANNWAICRLPSGSKREFHTGDLYTLTGQEEKFMPEELPGLNTVPSALRRGLLAEMVGDFGRQTLTTTSELGTDEFDCLWWEIGFRAVHHKMSDVWPPCRTVLIPTNCLWAAVDIWRTKTGSPDLQEAAFNLRERVKHVLADPRSKACVCLPLCVRQSGHWVYLSFRREAAGDDGHPADWEIRYADSLPAPSETCRDWAVSAMGLLAMACPEICPENAELPNRFNRNFQAGGTQCGFYCLGWLEADYRWQRGEGEWAPNMDLRVICPLKTRWLNFAVNIRDNLRERAARAKAKAQGEHQSPNSLSPPPGPPP